MPGIIHNAATNLRNTIATLKAKGNTKNVIINIITASGRFNGWSDLSQAIGIVYDSLNGASHAVLAATYSIHSQIDKDVLIRLTEDSVFDTVIQAVGSGEFLTNSHTPGSQLLPTIANLTNGGFVVSWRSDDQDGSGRGVYAQRYNSNYAADGGEFIVNTVTADDQQQPNAGGLTNGGFVIVWHSGSGITRDVFGKIYDADGVGGLDFSLSDAALTQQEQPEVAGLANGDFAVAWQGIAGSTEIYARVFDVVSVVTSGFVVNTIETNSQTRASIAALGNGGFVVTWTSNHDSQNDIYFRTYDSDYNSDEATETIANTNTLLNQQRSIVSGLANGGFVIVWQGSQDGATDVYGQIYDASYDAVGGEFQANSFTPSFQRIPAVSGIANGWFVVAWESDTQDGDSSGVFAKIYDQDGNVLVSEFQVNNYAADSQSNIVVSGLTNGGFVVSWDSFQDSSLGIYTEVYEIV